MVKGLVRLGALRRAQRNRCRTAVEDRGPSVIPPFLTGLGGRIYAANFSFCAGVIPPMPILGLSLL